MKQQSDLFDLIKSMSRSEKRYFTLHAKKNGRGHSRYLDLFKAVNKMGQYEEGSLQQQFGPSLPTDKHYLYESILQSMRDYNLSKSRTAKIKTMLLDARLLYQRGLYQQSEERLQQAHELAQAMDDQLALLEISREQLNFVWTTKPQGYGEKIDQLLSEKDDYIRHINEELTFLSMAYKIQLAKDQGQQKRLQEEIGEELFSSEEGMPETAHAQRRYLQCGALFADLREDHEEATQFYARMVAWWDAYPLIREESYNRYLADAFNLLHATYTQKRYAPFKAMLQRLSNEKPVNYHDQRLAFKQLANYQLLYHINLGIAEGHQELIKKVEEGMALYRLNEVSRLIIAFNVTVLLLILGQPEACRRWGGTVLDHYNSTLNSTAFRCSTLLIVLLAAISQDDIDGQESASRALSRSVRKATGAFPADFFRTAAAYLKKIGRAAPGEAKGMLEALAEHLNTNDNKPPLGMDDLLLNWIQSRLSGLPLNEVFRKQAQAGEA